MTAGHQKWRRKINTIPVSMAPALYNQHSAWAKMICNFRQVY